MYIKKMKCKKKYECTTRNRIIWEAVQCPVSINLCEIIGMFIKNYKSTNPGSNKVVYGPCEQESEEKS